MKNKNSVTCKVVNYEESDTISRKFWYSVFFSFYLIYGTTT